MKIWDDPCLDRLGKAYFGAMQAKVPNLVTVRASRELLHEYIVWCVRNKLWVEPERTERRPSLQVIINDEPVRPNPRRMSSPIKTDEIREFETRVSRIFGISLSAMMEWPTDRDNAKQCSDRTPQFAQTETADAMSAISSS